MKFYILVIKNKIKYATEDDIEKLKAWIKRRTPFEPEIEIIETDLSLKHKDFGVKIGVQSYWGLDGIKQQLRETGKIENGAYHAVCFLYELGDNWDFQNKPLGAWTYPNDLNGAAFFEIPSVLYWEKIDDLYRMMTHEIIHAWHRICWWKGIATRDTMDKYDYDKEMEVEAPDGNRERNLKELSPFWQKIAELPKKRLIVSLLGQLVALYQALIALKAGKKSRLEKWAEAIKIYEGWFEPGQDPRYSLGSRSFRNFNPGNLKYAGQKGATGQDKNGFAIFESYDAGWQALIKQLRLAAAGKSKIYNSEMTLIEFFEKYAPGRDNNDPKAYALFVAQKLKTEPTIKIKELL